MTVSIVDAFSLPRWSSTPVPEYGNILHPSNSGRTQSPFPVRQDVNAKVALWWVFTAVCLVWCVVFRSFTKRITIRLFYTWTARRRSEVGLRDVLVILN